MPKIRHIIRRSDTTRFSSSACSMSNICKWPAASQAVYAPATKALTAVVDQAAKGTRFPPPVILGAIIGLERHAQFHASLAPKRSRR